ncbi:hypothetical protein KIH39_25225 [Telmatocola sphagniphila]|uniref:Uncharacterized protein n=1 Tax=Telmatocola sphagniphila TaxID=1123043 RepID=A0A8E6B535_9BACT|nr:hypothetical protein [Telmatocola sphagniphila]QVL32098.1 hypothetical protein KIH39_25225 [Telmatocola sphagniphila]
MESLQPGHIVQFMKRFNFRGGRLLALKLLNRKNSSQGLLLLRVKTPQGDKCRLKLALDEVLEYRFQRRPFVDRQALTEVRLGYFDGVFYFNLDAFAEDGPPKIIDFRNSEAYIAATRFSWEAV